MIKGDVFKLMFEDSDCPEICVIGGCSTSCSKNKRCPAGYWCMAGRCFAQCDLSDGAKDEPVCGTSEFYQCKIGFSSYASGTGICVYVASQPPTSQLVRVQQHFLIFKNIVF